MYLHQHSHHLLYYHFLHHHHHHPLHHHGESLQFPDPQSLQTVHLQNHNIYSDVNLFTIKVYDLFIDLNCFSAYKSFHRFELFQNINFIGFPLNKWTYHPVLRELSHPHSCPSFLSQSSLWSNPGSVKQSVALDISVCTLFYCYAMWLVHVVRFKHVLLTMPYPTYNIHRNCSNM